MENTTGVCRVGAAAAQPHIRAPFVVQKVSYLAVIILLHTKDTSLYNIMSMGWWQSAPVLVSFRQH